MGITLLWLSITFLSVFGFDVIEGSTISATISSDDQNLFREEAEMRDSPFAVQQPFLLKQRRAYQIPYRCNFDAKTQLCGMIQSRNDRFDWILYNGRTLSPMTGPGAGSYIYVEASGKQLGEDAIIETPTLFAKKGRYYVSFKYHLWGKTMGSLDAKVLVKSGKTMNIFFKSGDLGNEWKSHCTSLVFDNDSQITVQFRGVVGPKFYSDIAIDEVKIARGACPTNKPSSRMANMSCSFEKNFCGFTPVTKGLQTYKWLLKKGPTPSGGTGPTTDATGRPDGFYVYAEASGIAQGQEASLVSPYYTVPRPGKVCLQFSFHMYGEGMGSLHVYAQEGADDPQRILEKKGDAGNRWVKVKGEFQAKDKVRIIFKGVRGSSYMSDIALDDISLLSCS